MKVESLLRRYRVYKSKSSGRTLRPASFWTRKTAGCF